MISSATLLLAIGFLLGWFILAIGFLLGWFIFDIAKLVCEVRERRVEETENRSKWGEPDFELVIEYQGLKRGQGLGLLHASTGSHDHGVIEVECSSPLHDLLTERIAKEGWPDNVKIRTSSTMRRTLKQGDLKKMTLEQPDIRLAHRDCWHSHHSNHDGIVHAVHIRTGDFMGSPTSIHLADLEDRRREEGGVLNPNLRKRGEQP